jgi:protein-S-isoprenylcysteine O-methyltransferase Ste14
LWGGMIFVGGIGVLRFVRLLVKRESTRKYAIIGIVLSVALILLGLFTAITPIGLSILRQICFTVVIVCSVVMVVLWATGRSKIRP